jgi:hypothetical protein
MTKGRTVPPLPTFTFKDSGITVKIRKLSPFMGDLIGRSLRKERAAPEPPINMVQYGDGKPTPEPNAGDPAYLQALGEYEAWVAGEAGKRMMNLVIESAIVVDDVDTDEVARVRATMKKIGAPIEDEMTDREVYIRFVCVGTPDDLEDLMTAATRRSQPTEAVIAENVTAFRREVS